MDPRRRRRDRRRARKQSSRRRNPRLHAFKEIHSTRINTATAEDRMGHADSIGQVARDPRVLGIPSPVSAVHAAQRRAEEVEDRLARKRQMDSSKLEDPGHNRSCVSVVDRRKLSDITRADSEGANYSRFRRIGIAILAIWCLASTGIALTTYSTIRELEQVVDRMSSEIQSVQIRNQPEQ